MAHVYGSMIMSRVSSRGLQLSLCLCTLLFTALHISAVTIKSSSVDHAPGPGLIGRSLYLDAAHGLPLNAGVHGLTPDVTKGVPLMDVHKPYSVRIDYAAVDRAVASVPLIVSTVKPRFSWQIGRVSGERDIQQTAYRLRIKQTTPTTRDEVSLDFDSGNVLTSKSTHVQYRGPALRANTAYRFSLSYILRDGRHSDWSEGEFRTGLVLRDDGAETNSNTRITQTSNVSQWIGDIEGRANQFRFDFNISVSDFQKTVSAQILLATAGYGELYVNGSAVDPTRKLDPSWTEYESYMLYATYSVLPMLSSGPNTVGVWLGHSWYSAAQWMSPLSDHKPQYGSPRFSLTLQMNLKNGSMLVLTSSADSGQWLARVSPVIIDGIYSGEIVDARLSDPGWCAPLKNRSLSYHWHPVSQLPWQTSLRPAVIPPIRIIGLIQPVAITRWGVDNQCIWDFGQHFSGWVRFSIKDVTDTRGIQIRVRYAEILAKGYDDTLYTASNRGAASTDTFVLSGVAGEVYEPRFTYHGARYVEVVGIPGGISNIELVGVIVHSYAPQTGHLQLNHSVLDQIQQNVVWGESTNLMSIPTACDQRDERTGFNGDIGLAVDGSFFNIEALPVHAKYLDDQEVDQRSDGSYDITSPTNNYGPGGISQPNWGVGFARIIWAAYSHFQDVQLLTRHYDSMTRWMEWLEAQYQANGIIHIYGWDGPTDWVPPPPHGKCNGSLTSSFGYLANMDIFINVSIVLNKTDAMNKWTPIYAARAKEFHNSFYVSESVGYADGFQTCNALALALPLAVPPQLRASVAAALAASVVNNDYRLTTGIVGTAQLFPMLSANGHHDVAMQMATGIGYPSYGYQFNNEWENSTTIWELWNADQANGDMNSRNLIMFSSIGSWFWRYCAGIQLDGNSGNIIRLEPLLPSPELNLSIHSMDASYVSLLGLIRVSWSREQSVPPSSDYDILTAHITVPHNAQAKVLLPHPHPSQPTQVQQLWEWDATEDTSASQIQQRRLLKVQDASIDNTETELVEEPSNGVRAARWLSQERTLELHLSSGSFGFQLIYARTQARKEHNAVLYL